MLSFCSPFVTSMTVFGSLDLKVNCSMHIFMASCHSVHSMDDQESNLTIFFLSSHCGISSSVVHRHEASTEFTSMHETQILVKQSASYIVNDDRSYRNIMQRIQWAATWLYNIHQALTSQQSTHVSFVFFLFTKAMLHYYKQKLIL